MEVVHPFSLYHSFFLFLHSLSLVALARSLSLALRILFLVFNFTLIGKSFLLYSSEQHYFLFLLSVFLYKVTCSLKYLLILASLLACFLSFSLPPSPFPLVFLQFCLTICLTNVKLPKVIMEAYQLDTKLSLVYNLVLSLWRIECIVCVCNVYVGVFVSAFVQLQRNCTDVAHVRVRGQHVVALVLFSLDFFHFRFSHSHAFTLALTPSRNIHALYYSLQNINYFHLFI